MSPPPLSRARYALLRALARGATVDDAAQAMGWTRARVQREATAALTQLAPTATSLPRVDAGRAQAQRPALAAEIVIEPAPPGADHRVVHDPRSGRYARIKLPQAGFLESLDGSRTVEELRASTSLPVPALLKRFAELGLLAGAKPAAGSQSRTPGGWYVQLATFDPEHLLARGRRAICALARAPVLAAAACVAPLGAIAFAVNLDGGLLSTEHIADPTVAVTLLAALLATAVAHELGHAAAVVYFGGRVRRMGFMLFYLLPALFCDTSDAWRFPFRRQRVVVALAGIATQLVLVGVVAQALWLDVGDGVRAWILLFVLVNLGMCAYNLIPFVKLDGYWAMATALDIPNLRNGAMARAAAWLRRIVLGEPLERRPGDGPLVTFGIACALFAPALVVYALLRWEDLLLRLGWAGAATWLLLVAAVATRPLARAAEALRRAARHARAAGVLAALLAVAAAGAALVRVPTSAQGELADSNPLRATMTSGATSLVEPGDRVDLGDRWLVSDLPEARGLIVRRAGGRWVVAVVPGERRPRGDDVVVRTGRHAVGAWLWHAHLRPAFSALRP